ncbi:MAG: Holliday junction resolvase RuvX [Corynebacterium sp.]|uniref:Holliday junction resolvase RuvX n=1 Tax=Corynebacterium sp. TaxID=1720 RepID=UPI0026DD6FBE|nr:Holliday junction resolvase RuvX [Corynebacterium sp.]MDO5097800.1 Holliday junction resolvase RuvX [Corynebacterium sp.]
MAEVKPDQPGVDDPGPGRRLGVDVGSVRIGVALSGTEATMAMPLETISRLTGFKDSDKADIDRLIELIVDNDVVEVVVGLPRDLQGNGSKSVKHAKEIAFRIRRRLRNAGHEIPVRMGDERLSTVIATTALRSSGRSEKAGRKVVDQAAAVEILQSWLDGRRSFMERHAPISPQD